MRPSDDWERLLGSRKHPFAAALAERLMNTVGVVSVTLTGSFIDQRDLSGISDIDTVVIVERLTPAVFSACRAAVATVSCALLGLEGHALELNTSFGPLKFDGAGKVIVHLMIYAIDGHRTHVLHSPFTCLDWERSPIFSGRSLREIYPVLTLQPRQVLESRRGLADYLDDLTACAIRFRRYEVQGDTLIEVTDRAPLDPRHQGEFAYHIVRNLVGNYAKVVSGLNTRLPTPELLSFWATALPQSARFAPWFGELETAKRARMTSYPASTLDRTREFLFAAGDEIDAIWRRRAVRHAFVRHAHTALNDGRFLGQRRDPAIAERPEPLSRVFAHVYASPALRTQQTATFLHPSLSPTIDPRLHEIDYGQAEGLDADQLKQTYPHVPAAWKRGEDAAFPDGENSAAVRSRLESFLADLPPGPSLVVTHNVVLRCLLGAGLGVPMSQWHLIPIEHNEPFEVLRLDGRTYLDLTAAQMAKITDAVSGFRL